MIPDSPDDFLFADEPPAPQPTSATPPQPAAVPLAPWKILIADDEPDVHHVTRLALHGFQFADRGLELFNAYSMAEAQVILRAQKDIAVALLDVVMEYDDAGLRLVQYIRNDLKNKFIRIILRTGQPGQAPERHVITHYDINDYKAKTELTAQKLFSAMVTALRSYRAERALFDEKEKTRVTLLAIAEGIISADAAGNIAYMNPAAEKLLGVNCREVINQPAEGLVKLLHEPSGQVMEFPLLQALREQRTLARVQHLILVRPDGERMALEGSAAPVRDAEQRVVGAVFAFHDVTLARDMANRLAWQASHDTLTGLANRREFERRVEAALERVARDGNSHSLLYIDLDNFKIVNDTCGHAAGDRLLSQLSSILLAKVRHSDLVARLGGDEFGVLLDRCPQDRGLLVAENLRSAVKEFRFTWKERRFEVAASIGYVLIDTQSTTLSELMSAADVACYAAKETGNKVHIYRESNDETMRRRREMDWVARITAALEGGDFELYYQPIAPLHGEEDRGRQEILLRLRDEQTRLIPPDSFIPAAERYRMMPSVDRWVVHQVALFQRALLDQQQEPPVCAVNLSGASVGDDGMLEFIQAQLREYRLPGYLWCFEITETAAIGNLACASLFMQQLKALGCSFALDDFGIGLSSFGYLKNLPVDYLKIDGSFVRDILTDTIDCAMVDAINQIGHLMSLKTIAEYAEHKDIIEKLRELKVDYAQGYGVSIPRPLRELYPKTLPNGGG
jgi:diguanylate cyclase (GGDEF)-like protein/PAS domain S-box-containing protein